MSVLPNVPGVPWWAAIVIAVTAAAVGFAFDAGSGDKELTLVFSTLYVIGCVAAVLAVRQTSVFTAVVQPPLLLFIVVPGAYWLFNGAGFPGIKEIAINCGYPLIERFPLMLVCSLIVLVIGATRWYLNLSRNGSSRKSAKPVAADGGDGATHGRLAGLAAMFRRPAEDDESEDAEASRRHTPERAKATGSRATRTERPAKRPAATRSRHVRPPLSAEGAEPTAERPRRRRPDPAAAEHSDPDLREARRRARTASPRENRETREPRERREVREPRRRDLPPLDREYGRRERLDATGDYEVGPRRRRPRPEGYETPSESPSYEPTSFETPGHEGPGYETRRRRRPSTNGSSTHHPFSNVRYRGAEDGEAHVEHRSRRPKHARDSDDHWRYRA